jgi:hypothetical protein
MEDAGAGPTIWFTLCSISFTVSGIDVKVIICRMASRTVPGEFLVDVMEVMGIQ